MTDDKKNALQATIDNLLYIEGYKDKLIEFNKQFIPNDRVKYNNKTTEFLFGLDKAIH